MTLDLDQLEALAKAAQDNSENIGEQDWYEADEISSLMHGLIAKADAGLMAGCTPPVILALIAEVRLLHDLEEAIRHDREMFDGTSDEDNPMGVLVKQALVTIDAARKVTT